MNSATWMISLALTTIAFTSLMAQDDLQLGNDESIRQWIADLDSGDYVVRQNATHELVPLAAYAAARRPKT